MRSRLPLSLPLPLLPLLALCALGCAKQAPPGAAASASPQQGVSALAPSSSAAATQLPQGEVTWRYADTPLGPMNAVVVIPARAEGERFPVLLTFHGMGEARKGPEKGARGWIDDYGLLRAIERLRRPPLTAQDFEGFADPERLANLNAALAKDPYRG